MSKNRSKWKNTPEGKTVKRNSVAQYFASRPVELIAGPAMRVLSRAAHLVLLRIELELRSHAGHGNGRLIVTKEQFVEFGIHQDAIAPALREMSALGIIVVTVPGRAGNAEHRQPNKFLLNYMCGAIDAQEQITNTWKRFKTVEEAEEVASAARKAKDQCKLAYGRRTAQKQNISQTWKPCPKPDMETMSETAKFSDMETMSTGPDTETMSTIDISGGGGAGAGGIQKGKAGGQASLYVPKRHNARANGR
jgi:hypothetical protein